MEDRSAALRQLSISAEQREERGGRGRGWLVAVPLLAALIFAGWWMFLRTPDAVLVNVATASRATAASSGGAVLDGSGYVVARRQATVSAKTTGKVVEVLIEEGMQVEEGQVLARLDSDNTVRSLQLSEAQLASARSRVRETEVQLKEAERELARQQGLIARKLTAQQALDQAASSVDSLRARVASARSEIQVAAASLEIYRQQMDDNVIRAPFAGQVIAKAAQPGEMISPISAGGGFTRTGIGTIVDMSSLEVEIDVGEAFIAKVKRDQPAQITLNSYPDEVYPGYVIAIIPAADRTKATVKVRVGFRQRDERVLPEMGARVRFLSDEVQPAAEPPKGVIIPASAVVSGQVFLVRDDVAQALPVTIAETKGASVRIEDELQPGDSVIVSPPPEVRDGTRIRTR